MPSNIPAATSCYVVLVSSLLGDGFPEGWLCAITTLAALSFSGPANTSRGCAKAISSRPMVTVRRLMTCPALSSDRQTKYSCRLWRMKFRYGSKSSAGGGRLVLLIDHHQAIARHPAREHVQLFAFKLVSNVDTVANGWYTDKVVGSRECYISFKLVVWCFASE